MKKTIFIFCALALISGCGKKTESMTRNEDGSTSSVASTVYRVRTESAKKMKFYQRMTVFMNATPSYSADLSPKIAGVIESFKAGGGTKVKKDDFLFQTDRFQLEANLMIAEEDLKVTEASYRKAAIDVDVLKERLKKAQVDYDRNRKLYEENAISKDKFEQIELALSAEKFYTLQGEAALQFAGAKVEQSKSNIAIAKRKLEDSIVRAPFDGTIVDTYYDIYEYAPSGQKVARIESDQELELASLVSGRLYNDIKVGVTKAFVECPATGYKAVVTVSSKSAFIDPATRTFEFKLKLPKHADVLSGMICKVDVILSESEGWGLPDMAFVPRAGGTFVIYADVDGHAKEFNVKQGIRDGGMTEIANPPENVADLKFVVEGQSYIENGSLLSVVPGKE